ncbi:hypothetical protein [Leptolyngbya sp. PCC 6406]|uniref:hypothetical protein n=1 Tax=Leptolyngbya sp. PCC 6406 TaxID=1173264 RepID=UPI0002ACA4D3|nr:hypothetical protein [Leptolyngbya sp. PCC 6406]
MDAIILALIALGCLIVWLNRQRFRGRRQNPRVQASPQSLRSHSSDTVSPRLMGRLDRLTRDRRVSERLIERLAFDNPNRSKRWCVEKAIYDIQRDRRA